MLHYENTTRSFRNCDEIISYIHQNHDPNYGKANDHYIRLKDKIPTAINRAQILARNQRKHDERPDSMIGGTNDPTCPDSPNWTLNPYTDVHLIFESFRKKGFITDF